MSLSVHIDYKNKDIVILGKGQTQGLRNTTLTEEAIYSINFTQPNKRSVLSLHYTVRNSLLFINTTEITDTEYYWFQRILQLIIWKNTGLKEIAEFFSVDFDPIDTNDILDIYRYLIKVKWYKIFFSVKKVYVILISIVNTNWVLLSNQKSMIQPTSINSHPNEYGQEFHYYLFAVKLDRCDGSCNILNDLSNKVCVPNII